MGSGEQVTARGRVVFSPSLSEDGPIGGWRRSVAWIMVEPAEERMSCEKKKPTKRRKPWGA